MPKSKGHGEVANIPPELSDLHCFTETEGVITTSLFLSPCSIDREATNSVEYANMGFAYVPLQPCSTYQATASSKS